MFTCAACNSFTSDLLCSSCRPQLRPGGQVMVGGMRVGSGLRHVSVARRLVHLLKYQGIDAAGEVLARVMAAHMPSNAAALIPVPRAPLRRMRYGVDPAVALSRRVGAIAGVEVVSALKPPLWWPSHAGGSRARRRPPSFRMGRPAPVGAVLVDDVLTTGATLVAAGRILGVSEALTATRADNGGFG